jgi:hypothetical protein
LTACARAGEKTGDDLSHRKRSLGFIQWHIFIFLSGGFSVLDENAQVTFCLISRVLIARSGELAARHPEQLSNSARSSSIFGDRLTTEPFAFGFSIVAGQAPALAPGTASFPCILYSLLSFETEPLVNRLFKRIQGRN